MAEPKGLSAKNLVSNPVKRFDGARETPGVLTIEDLGRFLPYLLIDGQQRYVEFLGCSTPTSYTSPNTQVARGRIRHDLSVYNEVAVLKDHPAEFSREAHQSNHGKDEVSIQ